MVLGKVALGGGQTGGLAVGAAAPLLELGVAVRASAAVEAAGVVAGVLVQGDLETAVVVAEDVATLAAVVAARKVRKVPLACCVIANR